MDNELAGFPDASNLPVLTSILSMMGSHYWRPKLSQHPVLLLYLTDNNRFKSSQDYLVSKHCQTWSVILLTTILKLTMYQIPNKNLKCFNEKFCLLYLYFVLRGTVTIWSLWIQKSKEKRHNNKDNL